MYKKVFISFLVLALTNFLVGCYSSELVNVAEYRQVEEEGKPDEIFVETKDSQRYHFLNTGYYIENDTLYGKGAIVVDGIEQAFEGKFALSDIESIQFEDVDGVKTTVLVIGIVAILIIIGALIASSLSFGIDLGG